MDFSFTSIVLSLLLIFFLRKAYAFARNYVRAVRTGYPVFVSPILSKSVPWIVFGAMFQPQMKAWLPGWIYERLDITLHGWEFRQKTAMHDRLGKTFLLVTPDEIIVWSADPEVGNSILVKRKDFLQASITGKIIGLLGPNVLIANGEDWQRQRRLLAPIFNERVSEAVWKESCRQAQTMMDYFVDHPGAGGTLEGLHNIAINVLGAAGYGQIQDWTPKPYKTVNVEKRDLSYFNAISLITIMLMEAAFLPPKLLRLSIMPPAMQLLGKTMEDMPRLARDLLGNERREAKQRSTPRSNLLSMLVQLSDQGKKEGSSGLYLKEEEIQGNLFTFSVAGFDTTANTMGYAAILLTIHPEWQDWMQEELQKLPADSSTWDYEETYPKCKRVLAVMFETLRLFHPVLHTTREIHEDQQVTDSKGIHHLTAPMEVYVSAQVMHVSPEYWGPDAAAFRPSRWLDASGELITPIKGTFLPWSGGPRVCPGMKMAQVEFVATFATFFRSTRCEPLLMGKQTAEEARKELEKIMKDSVPKLTLQVRNPEKVQLKWIRDRA